MTFNEREYIRSRTGCEIITIEGTTAEGMIFINDYDQLVGACFSGKRKKSDSRFAYKSKEEAVKKLTEYLERVKANEETKRLQKEKEKADKKAFAKSVKVGDIFVCSWGYEQTNVDAYQVVEKKGMSVVLKEIATEQVKDSMFSHGMACNVKPVKDSFLKGAEPFTKRLSAYKSIRMNSYSSAFMWNEESDFYRSWYA